MKKGAIWKISVATTAVAEDAVAELLGNIFGQAASSFADFETGKSTVTVYCATRPEALVAKRAALHLGLAHLNTCGLKIGSGRISVRQLPHENWAESWKRHFKPLEIQDALLIKPSWNKGRPRCGQAVVVLDPGLSFGTGHHPTTAFCLRELVNRRVQTHPQSFLDIGTGSGILAIAAAKLGYALVHAFDFDPEAVRIARANARTNRVLHKIHFARRDLASLTLHPMQCYDLICANLISTLLVEERMHIVRRLNTDGALVLAGILKSEFSHIKKTYEAAGLRLVSNKSEKEWQSGTFELHSGGKSKTAAFQACVLGG